MLDIDLGVADEQQAAAEREAQQRYVVMLEYEYLSIPRSIAPIHQYWSSYWLSLLSNQGRIFLGL